MAVANFLAVHTAIGAAANGIGVGKLLLPSFHALSRLSLIDSYSEASSSSSFCSPSARVRQISSVCSNAVHAVAAPPLRLNICRVPRRSLLRRKPRTKRRLPGDDSAENLGDEGLFDGGGGPFDDGGFGGSSGGWNYNRFGEGRDDGDESSSSWRDAVFLMVYQVVSWIMLLECLHFAFKKIVRPAAKGIVGAAIDKLHRKLGAKEIHTFRDVD
ncbi:hypothetical protein K1719_037977 [Acacia pycnantha]|nr:hypothetical protein K1719_037977 [Acacia pycnantha]